MTEAYWKKVAGSQLRQGDYLTDCAVAVHEPGDTSKTQKVGVQFLDLIVLTQSCDLEQKRARLVAMCPIYSIREFEEDNPDFKRKGIWNEVRKGRLEGLHMLGALNDPANNREALVVDFREIYSLPYEYIEVHAKGLGQRWRLKSPFLEHFSQAFARYFMRVGLPSTIPEFR